MKAKRQATLLRLIEEGKVDSQITAAALLADAGFSVTQTTVSRDLDELGTVRVRDGEGVRYATIEQSSQYGASFLRVLKEYVISRQASGNLIVFKTPPGHANVVAAALDRMHLDGVLGIVAGDDTLFACVDDRLGGATVLELISRLEEQGN